MQGRRAVGDFRHQGLTACGARQVGLHANRLAARRDHLGLQRLGISLACVVVDEQPVPLAPQMPRHGPAQPLRASRHQGIARIHVFSFQLRVFGFEN